jgi:spore germination cell wall hydrolase CwlJ-like protein
VVGLVTKCEVVFEVQQPVNRVAQPVFPHSNVRVTEEKVRHQEPVLQLSATDTKMHRDRKTGLPAKPDPDVVATIKTMSRNCIY